MPIGPKWWIASMSRCDAATTEAHGWLAQLASSQAPVNAEAAPAMRTSGAAACGRKRASA